MPNRTGLTKQEFNRAVEQRAQKIYNDHMRLNNFWPKQVCRREALNEMNQKHFIVKHDKYKHLSERDYLVEDAVENGRSYIFYQGRQISIM